MPLGRRRVPEGWTKKIEKLEKNRSKEKVRHANDTQPEGPGSSPRSRTLTLPLMTPVQHMNFKSDLFCREGCERRASASWM